MTNFQIQENRSPDRQSAATDLNVPKEDLMDLERVALRLIEPGKGILAADESSKTIQKRFDAVGIPCTPENRCAYRAALFSTPGLARRISGVILFEETLDQTQDGVTLPQILQNQGIVVGIKVDQGLEPFGGSEIEQVTKGLSALSALLQKAEGHGAQFSKWRGVITIKDRELPTEACMRENARRFAEYAYLSQQYGIVPAVEPEVLKDGKIATHDIERCAEVTARNLAIVFEELVARGVYLPGMLLKTNMVVPGKYCPVPASAEAIAQKTIDVIEQIVPKEVPGIVFLSGGQSTNEAMENLRAINALKTARGIDRTYSFSYGRALQEEAMKAFKETGALAAQDALIARSEQAGLATLGQAI